MKLGCVMRCERRREGGDGVECLCGEVMDEEIMVVVVLSSIKK